MNCSFFSLEIELFLSRMRSNILPSTVFELFLKTGLVEEDFLKGDVPFPADVPLLEKKRNSLFCEGSFTLAK